ncbi:MAG: asparagine-linked glycosylation protein [Chrysothrix sp. TS-e1954]|nr:MAG: asparagine-linked glycosylation protein [Chrysothrix sp. TS-e1954]
MNLLATMRPALVDYVLVSISLFLFLNIPFWFMSFGLLLGWRLKRSTRQRRELLLARVATERQIWEEKSASTSTTLDDEWEKVGRSRSHSGAKGDPATQADKDWSGLIGFFHPFCNAGGGGERVLWAAVRATQRRWPNATCVVYTGDHDTSKEQMLHRVKDRFNIDLYFPNVVILYLSSRRYVLASTWPHFTLLGQSIGSLITAYDAFSLVVPDIFIDTMGYAFALWLAKYLFFMPTGAYVHYPTISTDMLDSLDTDIGAAQGLNAGSGKGLKGAVKKLYWRLFSRLYGRVGGSVDVVMTNSSWTQNHIQQLWGPYRQAAASKHQVEVVYPPCAVEEVQQAIDVSAESEDKREPVLLYIAQFRPEKNHQLILKSFATFLHSDAYQKPTGGKEPRLLLLGSVRDSADETHVYSLRLLAHELHITENLSFLLNVSYPTILSHLGTASVGVNAMWNEHFGIGVVEYQAAGLISVVNNSGGPKYDIVVDNGNGPTGFHASTRDEYASGFAKALNLTREETISMRLRARESSKRFVDATFESGWNRQMERLVRLSVKARSSTKADT